MPLPGANAVLEISRDNSTFVSISQPQLGLDGFNHSDEEGTFPVAGGGHIAGVEPSGHTEGPFSFTVDENADTAPLLMDANGQVLYWHWHPEGKESGKPRESGRGPVTITHTAADGTQRRFQVEGQIDGDIIYGTV